MSKASHKRDTARKVRRVLNRNHEASGNRGMSFFGRLHWGAGLTRNDLRTNKDHVNA